MRRRNTPRLVVARVVMFLGALLGLASIALATNLLIPAVVPYGRIARSAVGPKAAITASPAPTAAGPVPTLPASTATRPVPTPHIVGEVPFAPPPTAALVPAPTIASANTIDPTATAMAVRLAPAVVTDQLDNLAGLADHSANLAIDTINQGYIGGDPARLVRTARTAEWAVWSVRGMTSFIAVTYHYIWEGPIGTFAFAASPDGAAYTPVTPAVTDRGGDWKRIDYALTLPAGTNFVRVTFPKDPAYLWTPQIGEVHFARGADPGR